MRLAEQRWQVASGCGRHLQRQRRGPGLEEEAVARQGLENSKSIYIIMEIHLPNLAQHVALRAHLNGDDSRVRWRMPLGQPASDSSASSFRIFAAPVAAI